MVDCSALVLALYRSAGSVTDGSFHEHALRLLQAALPFDSARWGEGVVDASGVTFHSPCLFNDTPEVLVDYHAVRHADWLPRWFRQNPGEVMNCNLLERATGVPVLQDYARRYAHVQGLVTAKIDAASGRATAISLYRASARRAFSEAQRRMLRTMVPHLQEALKINLRLRAEQFRKGDRARWRMAVADFSGQLVFCDPAFVTLLQQEWPEPAFQHLPQALQQHLISSPGRCWAGQQIVCTFFVELGHVFVHARAREAVDALTAREREVAVQIGKGLTHKEVARVLGISPATVNNHLRAMHARVGVANNAELAARLALNQS